MAHLTDIDIIKALWQELRNDGSKTEFIERLAEFLGKSPKTLRQHWFSNVGFWSVPEAYQSTVIFKLREFIKEQERTITVN